MSEGNETSDTGQETRDKEQVSSASSSNRVSRSTSPLLSRRVLIIGPSNIGDAILASYVVATVHRRFPEAYCTLAVGHRAKTLFVDDPRIHALIDVDLFRSAMGRLRLAWVLWRYRPQIVVDLRHTFYPLLLKPLTSWRYVRQPPKRVVHMQERHLWKLRRQAPSVGLHRTGGGGQDLPADPRSELPLWVSGKDVAHVETLRRRWQLDETLPLVVICPGARSHIKRWSAEGFARIADRLIAERRAQVVFSGEPDEKPIIEEILSLMTQGAHTAVGLTTVRQLGVLMRGADLVITNDSASLHLASAFNVPTVAIFGPTDAKKYGPTSALRSVVRRKLFCAPCEQALCRFSHECMRFVAASEVYQAATDLLDQNALTETRGGKQGADESS